MQDEFVFDSLYSIGSGLVQWRSPSNIALIKYWGKKPIQIPSNPSLSFCLSNCFTITKVSFMKNDKTGINYQFFFDGKKKNQNLKVSLIIFLKKFRNIVLTFLK